MYLQLEKKSSHVKVGSDGTTMGWVLSINRPTRNGKAATICRSEPDILTTSSQSVKMAKNRY